MVTARGAITSHASRQAPSLHIVTDRVVLTYGAPWPLGFITGYTDDRTFRVEHVVVFPEAPRSTLTKMLLAGLDEAWTRGYQSVSLHLPHAFPLTPKLTVLARRLGFDWYAKDGFASWWIKFQEPV